MIDSDEELDRFGECILRRMDNGRLVGFVPAVESSDPGILINFALDVAALSERMKEKQEQEHKPPAVCD
jgi:hypothetical protein